MYFNNNMENLKLSKELEWISKFKEVHKDLYDYSEFKFTRAKDKSIISCREHGAFEQRPQNHAKGEGCPACGKKVGRSKKTASEFILEATKVHGDTYDYSNSNYQSALESVVINCKIHGEFTQIANQHLKGSRCPKCAYISRGVEKRLDHETLLVEINKNLGDNYSVITTNFENYNDVDSLFTVNCKHHGNFPTSFRRFVYNRNKCPKCSIETVSNANRKTTKFFIKEANNIHNNTYTYDKVDYVSAHIKVPITCKTHGDFLQTPNQHLKGQGCPTCGNKISKAELEIVSFIEGLGIKVITRNRTILEGKEIDILLPDLNLGIEFNGLIWHSEKFLKDNMYHLNKTNLAKEKGIDLIHIFEDEWNDKKEIVKSILTNKLNNSKKIFARKCEITKKTNSEIREFFSKNHLKGMANADVNLCLEIEGEIVACMSFVKPRLNLGFKTKEEGVYELLRYANKLNSSVIGGASRLLKYFEKEYSPVKIITYADRRYSTGDLYKRIGFTFLGETKPGYFYTRNGQFRENRFKFRKSELIKMGYDSTLTEKEIMTSMGYYRIYDCGNFKFEKILSDSSSSSSSSS